MSIIFSVHGLQAFIIILMHGSQMVSSAGNALLEAQTKGYKDNKHTVCIQYNPQFSEIASSLNSADPMTLIDLSKFTGCSAEDFKHGQSSFTGSAVAVSRGNCTFAEKADLVQLVNGSSVLIVDYSNSSKTVIPDGNATSYKEINITVTCIAWQDYHDVLSLPAPVEVRIYKLESSKFDPNMVVIVVASTMIVLAGALWTSFEENAKKEKTRKNISIRDVASSGCDGDSDSEQKEKGVEITPCIVICWVVCLCIVLLLLYFFFDVMVYFFIATFVIAGSHSMYSCIMPLWKRLVPFDEGVPVHLGSCINTKVEFRVIILLITCVGVAIFWAVERHASYAWILQDFMGATFCIIILKTLRLPSLKILTFMMILLFCYDVFFVFITPLFTKNGQSVMINVATGGNGDSGEMIPLVFLIPILSDGPETVCRDRGFSLLGFGDIILPGLLIVYNGLYGVHAKTKMYIISTTIAYAVGMSACLIALIFMEQGQPALFYLVPTTLITTYAVAFRRGEVRMMWKGVFPSVGNSLNTNHGGGNSTGVDDRDEEENLSCTPEEEEQKNLID